MFAGIPIRLRMGLLARWRLALEHLKSSMFWRPDLDPETAKPCALRLMAVIPEFVTAKDIALHLIGLIGTSGRTGYVIEYAGSAIRNLSMEGRMTICNMTIEAERVPV